MRKIIACVVCACLIVLMLNAATISPAYFSKGNIYVDSQSTAEQLDQQAVFDELFAPDSVVQIDVDISKEQLSDLQTDFEYYRRKGSRSSVYRICGSVTFDINGRKYVIEDVGLRLKGTSSRCSFFNDLMGIYNLVNFRMCFNCTFDDKEDYGLETRVWKNVEEKQKREQRTFATMQSIELKWNITGDNTYVRNRYVQEVFKDYGVPAQNCTLCTLRLGGCKLGVYRLFEPVDEGFIRRYFPEKDWGGDLYKVRCTADSPASYSPGNSYGDGSKKKNEEYNFDIKTNMDMTDHSSLRRLLDTVNKPDAAKSDFEAVMDMDELAAVQAINFAMGNQDDMRFNYNNHYIYFRKSDGKAVIIPYDNEVVLGETHVQVTSVPALTGVSPYVEENQRFGGVQEVPMLRQTVLKGGYFTDLYTACLREIVESRWFTEQHYETYFRQAQKNYGDKVISHLNFFSTMHMNMEFSMEGGEDYNGNMAVREYMERMKANILSHVNESST